jgi:hypothetical protein
VEVRSSEGLARIFRECRTGWISGADSMGNLAI